MDEIRQSSPAGRPDAASDLYRAFWRWHFYGGLVVLPVLMWMALTGAVYLFHAQIDAVLYRRLEVTADRPVTGSPSVWAAAATRELGGKVVRITLPARPGHAVRVLVETPAGRRTAFVDPHDGRLTGSIARDGVMSTVKHLHSLELLGPVANVLVEIVAGWAIVLVATGIFLWWPRGRGGGVIKVRGRPRQRVFWRDLHAVTGVLAAAAIGFLAVTGMPWSAVWGEQVRALTTSAGLGRPKPPAPHAGRTPDTAAAHQDHEEHAGHGEPEPGREGLPWALQTAPGPKATGTRADDFSAGLDRVAAAAMASDLGRPFVLSRPRGPAQAWTASYMPPQAEGARTLYLDGGSGRILGDVGFAQYGPAAKAIEWGIATHQGQEYGWLNLAVMLAGCVSIWILGVSAAVMWWKRRPTGGLGAPPRPADRRAYVGLALIVGPLALVYPLVGASILATLGADLAWRMIRRDRPA